MSNIFGSPFDSWVTEQINVRQKALGKGAKITSEELQYFNSKTPWIRLASAVDLTFDPSQEGDTPKRLKARGFPTDTMDGYELARNCVLFGGVTSLGGGDNEAEGFKLNKGIHLQSGVTGENSRLNLKGAYGWGGTTTRGIVPMPGITDASVEYYNNGALAKAIINIRCFSPEQFAVIDTLYMRPGYNLLLEFGWSMYLDNSGKLQNFDSFYTDPFDFLFNPGSSADNTHFTMYEKIVKERKERYGNYNGVFGKISKFNWNFNPDGSYNIQVTVQGYGDMMESLKVNIPLVGKDGKKDILKEYNEARAASIQALNIVGIGGNAEETPPPPLIANAGKTHLNFALYGQYLDSATLTESGFRDFVLEDFQNPSNNFKGEKLTIPKGVLSLVGTTSDTADALSQSPQVYLSLGSFLALVQNKLLIYDSSNSKKTPLFRFDFDFFNLKEDDNYFSYIPGMFSGDPQSVLIPYENPPNVLGDDQFEIPATPINDIMKGVSTEFKKEQYIARMGYIYINVNTIAEALSVVPTDDDGAISLLSILNGVLGVIATALGSFPLFSVKYDEDNNTIKIYDETPQRFSETKGNDQYALINTYGVKPDTEGSFVKNISLNSELSNEFASLIVIAAQSNSTQLSADSTSFGKYNAGLVDRIIPTRVNYETGDQEPEPTIKQHFIQNIDPTAYISLEQRMVADGTLAGSVITAASGQSLLGGLYKGNFMMEDIEALLQHNATFIHMLSGILVKEKQLQAPFFLPFNLKLDIEGLSGMRLFQKFVVDDSILPPSYERNSVDIQIKSLSHTLTPNDWVTSIDTIASPRSKMDNIIAPTPMKSSSTTQLGAGGGVSGGSSAGGNLPAPPPAKPPEDEKVRIILRRLCDNGRETLGVMTVLDANGKELYVLPTVELPWKNNQNSVSCIPPNDTYRVKSHKSSKHGSCFWIVGNGKGGYKFNALYGNGYVRSAVLIHRSPIAPGWLLGCIGPGLKFNMKQKNGKNPKGTGDSYLNPSKAQSQQAVDKLVGTLYSEGSFLMEIKNLNNVGEGQLPTDFNDPEVQKYLNASSSRKQLIS